jgi:hypothetical protein
MFQNFSLRLFQLFSRPCDDGNVSASSGDLGGQAKTDPAQSSGDDNVITEKYGPSVAAIFPDSLSLLQIFEKKNEKDTDGQNKAQCKSHF